MADPAGVLADLLEESDSLDSLVTTLDDWTLPTPAQGWSVGHQIGHLAWTDHVSLLAVTDEQGWNAALERIAADIDGFVDTAAAEWSQRPDLVGTWRDGRTALHDALRTTTAAKLPWFGPPMSPTSMATARLMETWAHGQDVADAMGVERVPTDRIRHVAHIGARTRDFAYAARSQTPPTEPFRVELTSPGGEQWSWGPEDAVQRVTGPALDFCLLVTQRRHRDDLGLVAEGSDADHWLDIAQAFAGPPGTGRAKAGTA